MKALVLLAVLVSAGAARAQATFAVATIKPSVAPVKFEHDGETKVLPDSVQMRDVSIETCIKWAYGVQGAQVLGPAVLTSQRYDIVAKADGVASKDEMKAMMRALLADRFQLAFHLEKKELRAFALVVAKGGVKPLVKQAGSDEVPYRQNTAMGTVVRATTIQEFADLLSSATEKAVLDKTGLAGRWDFAFEFTKYMVEPPKGLDDFLLVLNETLEGELGLKLVAEKDVLDVMVVDKVEKAGAN